VAEDFVEGIKEMLRGDIPARFDADMGEVWDMEEALHKHGGDWPDSIIDVFRPSDFDEPDGGWEAARARYVEEVDWADRTDGWMRMVEEQ
jgi:hypothetical protein